MKALILAGGLATRLRPLSCSKPKLLFPVVGVPLIDRMISWLGESGIREVVLAVNHLAEILKSEVGSRRRGTDIIFSVEETPLGTGGPIRLARRYIDDEEPFVVLNGDIVSDIDLRSMIDMHVAKSATATLALTGVRDPARYGSVNVTEDGRITRFHEKAQSSARFNLVNAGVYVLDHRIIRMIPSGPLSIERAIFPKLASRGSMWGMIHDGFWFDIGRVPDFVRANMEMLKRSYSASPRATSREGWATRAPVRLGKGFRAGTGSRVGPNAIVSGGVRVGESSSIRDSIIFENTRVGSGCTISGTVIGEKVTIGDHSRISRGSVVAGGISLPTGTIARRNSIILS